MSYAEVAVNSPHAGRKTFTYSIPPSLTLAPGHAVWVPFGPQTLLGIVTELSEHTEVEGVRPVSGLAHPEPLLSPPHLALGRWLSQYYVAPLFDSLSQMLPPGFARPTATLFRPGPNTGEGNTPQEAAVMEVVRQKGTVAMEEVAAAVGQRQAARALKALVTRGLLVQEWQVSPPRVGPKLVAVARLAVAPAQALEAAGRLEGKRSPRQAALLRLLAERGEMRRTELQPWWAAVAALKRDGLVTVGEARLRRDPLADLAPTPYPPPTLTPDQAQALAPICQA
ncbi:MAG: hypothetical protein AAB270_05780, partial [Chloroflexota bacterium]